jgi:hypothetical protein
MLGHLVTQQIDLAAYFTLWGIQYHGVWDNRGKVRPVHSIFGLFNEFGNRLLKAESDQPLLPAYAALREDGALSLMVVNKHPTASYRATIDLQGFSAAAPVRVLRHDQQQHDSASEYTGGLAPLDITFPPYSITMLVVPARPGLPAPLLWAGAGGAALLAGLAAWRLRRGRSTRPRSESLVVGHTDDDREREGLGEGRRPAPETPPP